MSVRNTDPVSSHEAAAASEELADRLCDRVIEVARAAGWRGITLSEAAELIPEHKATSITPRFKELLGRGQLVRVRVGTGEPTSRFLNGRPRYVTRFDEQTRRNVLVHWAPEFEPKAMDSDQEKQPADGVQ